MCPQRTTRRAHELLGETAAPKCLGRPQNAAETILPELRQRQTTEFPETLATAKRGTFRTPPSSLRICCRASIKVSHGALAKRPATQQNIYSRRRLILGVSFQVSKCPALAMSRGTSSMMVARPSAYSTIVLKERLSRALTGRQFTCELETIPQTLPKYTKTCVILALVTWEGGRKWIESLLMRRQPDVNHTFQMTQTS